MHDAKRNKNDEFYTRLVDIENEMKYYWEHFKGKTILLPCDDLELVDGETKEHRASKFWVYFHKQFAHLGLKKIIAVHYSPNGVDDYVAEYSGGDDTNIEVYDKRELEGDGDFRSPEVKEIFKEADIIITNPPFSLFREFIAQIVEFDKKFLIVGNKNSITYKETFKLILENKMWLGMTSPSAFTTIDDDGNFVETNSINGLCRWFTNLDNKKRNDEIILTKEYKPEEYPEYDNYKAINVDKVKDIPKDYFGVMGVPITFLDNYNPNQFEILDANDYRKEHMEKSNIKFLNEIHVVEKKKKRKVFKRIPIRRVQ